MKNKWLILVVLFIVLVTVYAVRGVFEARIGLEVLTTGKIEEAYTTQGVLIKNEKVNSVALSGTAEVYVKDGDRVANKEIIAALYDNAEDEALVNELAEINKKVNAIHQSDADNFAYISDAMQMESELANSVDEIIANSSKNDFSKMSEYKYKISAITSQKALARGETATTPAEELIILQTRKNEIENKLGQSSNIVSADMAGIFAEGKDGFEEALSFDKMESLMPEDINSVIEQNKDGVKLNDESTYTYRIMDNFSYRVAVNLDKMMVEKLKVGDNVTLRFLDFSQNNNKAVIKYISAFDENDMCTVVVECDSYVENLLSQRVVNVVFVKKSISGYKVDVEHIHTEENTVGLYIKRGAVMRFLPVTILYSNEEEAIVSSANPSMPIKAYDEVVISAPEFKDGRVIVSQ